MRSSLFIARKIFILLIANNIEIVIIKTSFYLFFKKFISIIPFIKSD